MTKEDAKQKISELVLKRETVSLSTLKSYHEEKTKAAFIRPLFSILGWNFDDINNVAPEEQASNGRVDYAFKLNGVSQFYLEAKALNKDINNPDYIKQATDYAYYKGVTWVVLTNFDELRIINAQEKKSFIDLKYTQYLSEFGDLWLLSQESFLEGLLIQKAAIKYGALTPPPPIEELLYHDLRSWRAELSTQLQSHNKKLSRYQMSEIIQKFFNRLIFIRTCEDRNIEDKRVLEAVRQWGKTGYKGELIETVKHIFKQYSGWYDSDLFEKHLIDTDKVFVEGQTVERILSGMAKYQFDLIDADVLGAVYEQYLGHVAVEDKEVTGHQLKLEIADDTIYKIIDKKKYRKERGIYYTPKYITSYIVQETVGRFIKENSPGNPNEIFNMKILDMSCGSGSFLIRAFDELLNYYAGQQNKTVYALQQHERLPILLRNIFGVDLDSQAIEITRLNLLTRSLSKREMLQPLADNIKHGNSLIPDNTEDLKKYFGNIFESKLAFNWEDRFNDIMNKGGFDVIVGNPPYVSVNNLESQDREYFMSHYETASKRFDIYIGFIERGLKLLKDSGRLGFIIPYPFLSQDYAEKLRLYILNHCIIESIVDFSGIKVFADPVVRNIIIILKKEPNAKLRDNNNVRILAPSPSFSSQMPNLTIIATVPQITFAQMPQTMFRAIGSDIEPLLSKITNQSFPLGTIAVASWGARGVPIKDFHLDKPINEFCKPMIKGKNVKRYALEWDKQWLLYDLDKLYRPAFPALFENSKIVISKVTGDEGLVSTYDDKNYYTDDSLCCCILKHVLIDQDESFFNKRKIKINECQIQLSKQYDLKYILGLINSRLLNYYYSKMLSYELNVYPESLEQLPIRIIDFNKADEKMRHNEVIGLVDKMLELKKKQALNRNIFDDQYNELTKEVEHTNKQIDNLVYDLYGLTEEERKIVEDSVKQSSKGAKSLLNPRLCEERKRRGNLTI